MMNSSSYGIPKNGDLVFPYRPARNPSESEATVHEAFRAFVIDSEFPCLAAKSAVRNENYRISHYADMAARESVIGLASDLSRFTKEPFRSGGFSTFVATFARPTLVSEREFECSLWAVLQGLDDLDRDHPWDPEVSSDPDDANFSFSFSGTAFFVIGLHPGSSRLARRFAYPTLIFNAHAQFESLRWEGKYERMQSVVRERDLALQGVPNASLADYGTRSEARQYSGRLTEPTWQCPFKHSKP